MDEPLSVRTINELHYYLTVTACDVCGKGPRVVESVQPAPAGTGGTVAGSFPRPWSQATAANGAAAPPTATAANNAAVPPTATAANGAAVPPTATAATAAVPAVLQAEVSCNHCHSRRPLTFISQFSVSQDPPESETINPTDQPSRLIDLGQWLSLFYLLVEIAARETHPAESRRISFRAALCLAEALKFYSGDDELPPAEAFFTADTREAFGRYPEKFARQRLRDMRAKLPALDLMARRVARDRQVPRKKRWWQIWR